MRRRKCVRGSGTPVQDRVGGEAAVTRGESARDRGPEGEIAYENDAEDTSSQMVKKQSCVQALKWKLFQQESEPLVAVPVDLGADESLNNKKRDRRDKSFERGLVWEHGGNQSVVRLLGVLILISLCFIPVLKIPQEFPFVSLIRGLMALRSAGRKCFIGEGMRDVEDAGYCSFVSDGSVTAGVTLAGALFAFQFAIVAIISFQSRVAVRRTGRYETVAANIFSSFKASLVFWSVMCVIWLSISYICLVWFPDLSTLWEQFPLVLVSAMPLWGFEVGSVVLPTLLYWHVVDYSGEDVMTRRSRIMGEYERAYSYMYRRMEEKDILGFVQTRGKSRRVVPWAVSGVALFALTVLSLKLGVARSVGALSVVAIFDMICVVLFAYAVGDSQFRSSFTHADKASLFVIGVISPVLLTVLVFVTGGSGLHLYSLAYKVMLLAVLFGVWMFVAMRGFYGARHPVQTILARRLLYLSDELVWLDGELAKIGGQDNGDWVTDMIGGESDEYPSAAVIPPEGHRGSLSEGREFRHISKLRNRPALCHRGAIAGLGGALFVLCFVRLRSSHTIFSHGE